MKQVFAIVVAIVATFMLTKSCNPDKTSVVYRESIKHDTIETTVPIVQRVPYTKWQFDTDTILIKQVISNNETTYVQMPGILRTERPKPIDLIWSWQDSLTAISATQHLDFDDSLSNTIKLDVKAFNRTVTKTVIDNKMHVSAGLLLRQWRPEIALSLRKNKVTGIAAYGSKTFTVGLLYQIK